MAAMDVSQREARDELTRVRRLLSAVDTKLTTCARDTKRLKETGDHNGLEDCRWMHKNLWKEKEQLRAQETIFLRILFADGALTSSPLIYTGGFSPAANVVPNFARSSLTAQVLSPTSMAGQKRDIPSAAAAAAFSPPDGHSTDGMRCSSGDIMDYENASGYEVARTSVGKVINVWREWKEGINGGPAVEKLEEARKKDRKLIWWRHKNDYKFWSKQMRIIRAVEKKAAEYGGNIEAAILFWEDILRVEFEGSLCKLREALGGEKAPAAAAAASATAQAQVALAPSSSHVGIPGAQVVTLPDAALHFKRKRKDLLQQGLERLKQWPQLVAAAGGVGPAPTAASVS